jgi:phage terminase large subunit-like protein
LTSLRTQGHKEVASLYTDWLTTARPTQITPSGGWHIWLILAGRGWGKTRTGAADAMLYALRNPEVQVAVVTPTFGDIRRVAFGGVSGILKTLPEGCMLAGRGQGYNSSASEIRLFNGSIIYGFSATEPDRLRGPQFHRAWCDELAAWRYPEAFDQLMFSLRLGDNPQCIITTTPRPTPLIRQLLERDDVVVTTGSTFENEANLASSTLAMLKEKYEGTALGRQELYAEVLDNLEGALWNNGMIDASRRPKDTKVEFTKVIVALDPAVTANADSDETGIVVVGKDALNKYYLLDDRSGKYTPDEWGRLSVELFYTWQANYIVAEVNNGGDLVERLIRSIDTSVGYRSVHASRGKMLRAEPISALYEQGKVHHLGVYPELESQMCTYTGDRPKPSPDRLDALVWGLTELSKSRGDIAWRVS